MYISEAAFNEILAQLEDEEDTYDEDVARHIANCKEVEYCKICNEY